MRPPRFVACDVDGTLLGPDGRVSPRTADAVSRVTAAGIPFVLVTGRPPRWVPEVAEQLVGVRLAVCANGAVSYDIAADRVHGGVTIPPAVLAELAETCAAVLPEAVLAVERAFDGAFTDPDRQFVCEGAFPRTWADSDRPPVSRAELLELPAIKMLVRDPAMSSDAMVALLEPLVTDRVDLTFSVTSGLVEVSPAGVTKASALAGVVASAGVDVADVIAFGDMPNDIAMLRWAGYGVAMGNAHPQLRAAADEITCANTEDGVALVLERWF